MPPLLAREARRRRLRPLRALPRRPGSRGLSAIPPAHAASPLRGRFAYLAASIAVVVLDQVTKSAVVERIPLHTTVPVIRGFFDLTHVRNTGAAFGLFYGEASAGRTIALSLVALAVFCVVLVYAWRTPVSWTRTQTGLALILGGAVGNLIDRVSYGFVTDFLRFYVGAHEWPSFNVADSAISVGVAVLAWDLWKESRPGAEKPSAAPSPPAGAA